MSEEFVQLRWNTHQSTFVENLSSLRDKQVFTDVTLSCGDQFYPAHRLILSSCSTFFARALGVVSCRSPVLLLHGIEQSTLEQLLMFMYDGQVTIARRNLPDLLKAAQWLGVKGLESTYDTHCNQTRESPSKPDNSSEQSSLLQCLQNWKQLMSPLSNNRECSGNIDMISALQTMANRTEGKSNNDMVVSQVASISSNSESDDISTELKLDAVEEDPDYEDTYLNVDNNTYPMPQSVSFRDIPEHFLEVHCSSQETDSSVYSFEGWEDVTSLDSNKSLRCLERERNITELDEVSDDPPCEEAENELTQGNVCDQAEAKGKRNLRCKHCRRPFSVRVELAKHLRTHHNSTKNFCVSCNETFINAKNFRLHMKLHDSDYLHSCSKCDFITHNKRSLNKHLLSHKDDNSILMQDDEQENSLQVLQQETIMKKASFKTMRSKTATLKCPSCRRIFKNYHVFHKHKVSGCSGIKRRKGRFSCPTCSYVGTRKRSLEDHMAVHTGVYRFHCTFCPYQCSRNNILQVHIKKTHLNV